jgi:hypothetical protein
LHQHLDYVIKAFKQILNNGEMHWPNNH